MASICMKRNERWRHEGGGVWGRGRILSQQIRASEDSSGISMSITLTSCASYYRQAHSWWVRTLGSYIPVAYFLSDIFDFFNCVSSRYVHLYIITVKLEYVSAIDLFINYGEIRGMGFKSSDNLHLYLFTWYRELHSHARFMHPTLYHSWFRAPSQTGGER